MKVYVVIEFVKIAGEECTDVAGVFSSEDKAKEAIAEYTEWSKDSKWRHEYSYIECEVDKVWEDLRQTMWITFCIALGIVIFGVLNYEKMSYKANYLRNKKNNTGYYWGGRPRDDWRQTK